MSKNAKTKNGLRRDIESKDAASHPDDNIE
jgi:hypothetical protein